MPTVDQAKAYLSEAAEMNPGPWIQHSVFVAQAAEAIATVHPILDPTTAYVLGYLHDIGRRAGVTDMRHTIDGYAFLDARSHRDAARICLTHSFPIQDARAASGRWDCTLQKWRAFLGLQQTFESAIGRSIYGLLPGVVENTFATQLSTHAD